VALANGLGDAGVWELTGRPGAGAEIAPDRRTAEKEGPMTRSRRLAPTVALVAAIAMTLASATTSLGAATVVRTITRYPVSMIQPSCNIDGSVEQVHLSGFETYMTRVMFDGSGTYHASFMRLDGAVAGYGETTGTTYHFIGISKIVGVVAGEGLPNEFELVDTYLLIGQGPGNNIVVHEAIHGFIDEDGEAVGVHIYYSGWNCR
jgi:hypothetical protein